MLDARHRARRSGGSIGRIGETSRRCRRGRWLRRPAGVPVPGEEEPVDVVLLDRQNHHLFQPLLYHVATGILSEGQIAVPLRESLKRYRNIRVELAEVTGFDLERRVVFAEEPVARSGRGALRQPHRAAGVTSHISATTSSRCSPRR